MGPLVVFLIMCIRLPFSFKLSCLDLIFTHGLPYLIHVVVGLRCMCVSPRMYVQRPREGVWYTPLIILCLIHLKPGLSMIPKLAISIRLARQGDPRICLFLPPYMPMSGFDVCVLGFKLKPFIFVPQVFLPMKLSPWTSTSVL